MGLINLIHVSGNKRTRTFGNDHHGDWLSEVAHEYCQPDSILALRSHNVVHLSLGMFLLSYGYSLKLLTFNK